VEVEQASTSSTAGRKRSRGPLSITVGKQFVKDTTDKDLNRRVSELQMAIVLATATNFRKEIMTPIG